MSRIMFECLMRDLKRSLFTRRACTCLCTKIAPPPVRVQGLVLVLILVLLLGFCAISIAFLLAASKMMADGLSNSLTHSLPLTFSIFLESCFTSRSSDLPHRKGLLTFSFAGYYTFRTRCLFIPLAYFF